MGVLRRCLTRKGGEVYSRSTSPPQGLVLCAQGEGVSEEGGRTKRV